MKAFLFVFLILCSSPTYAGVLEAIQSVCKIKEIDGSDCGSGGAYLQDEDYIYVITAGHVVENIKTSVCLVECYPNGRPIQAVAGIITHKDYKSRKISEVEVDEPFRDLAIIRIEKSQFKSDKDYPKCIKLATSHSLKLDDQILSIGCSGPEIPLKYPAMFNGYVSKLGNERFWFQPNVVAGRSGSPVFDTSGDNIVGIVIWRTNNGGMAIDAKGISEHFKK